MKPLQSLACSLIALFVLVSVVGVMIPQEAIGQGDEPVRAAFVFQGPIDDGGWNTAQDEGRKYMQEQLGDRVETTTIEDVPAVEAESVFDRLANSGYDLIVGTTFPYQDPMEKVAERYPDVKFMNAVGWKTGPNFDNYHTRMYQAAYLLGIIAGHQTEANDVGYVAAHPTPSVLSQINAYAIGVWEANPDAEVRVVFSGSWFDVATAREATMGVIDAGSDVIVSEQNSPAPLQAAEERGVWGFGVHTAMCDSAPEACLTSRVHNWGPYYVDKVESILEGNWEITEFWGGIREGHAVLTPLTEHIKPDAREAYEQAEQRFHEDSEWAVFRGPLRDKDGNIVLEEGETMTSKQRIFSIDYLLEGIRGSL